MLKLFYHNYLELFHHHVHIAVYGREGEDGVGERRAGEEVQNILPGSRAEAFVAQFDSKPEQLWAHTIFGCLTLTMIAVKSVMQKICTLHVQYQIDDLQRRLETVTLFAWRRNNFAWKLLHF